MTLVSVWVAVALAGFFLGCLYKAVRYATMPMHVRWELYPVAHEKGKVAYGGSYFEDLDWWTKPRHVSKFGEFKTIAEEVLTLKQVHENNPPLWLPSLLFHYGLYLLFALGGVLLVGAVPGVRELPGMWRLGGGTLLGVWAGAGLVLGTLGCLGLLVRRLSNPALKNASTPADFLHLWLLLAVFVTSLASLAIADRQLAVAAAFVHGLVTVKPHAALPLVFVPQVVLLGVFLAYLPWSHMTHFFAKYFTWHSVRWDDAPNVGGTTYAAKAQKQLMRPVSWSAPHIKGDGKKTWADVATKRGDS
ncbi:MAG: respiratory nitrate reductase subunit gamma [Acidobacteriota bacterium]